MLFNPRNEELSSSKTEQHKNYSTEPRMQDEKHSVPPSSPPTESLKLKQPEEAQEDQEQGKSRSSKDGELSHDRELDLAAKGDTPSQPRDEINNLVSWDGPNDPGNPRNWPMRKKWTTVGIVSLFTFISSISSSMVAPALQNIKRDLQIESPILSQMILSIFILAYGTTAVGPLLLGPLSELYGRVPILQTSNLFFLIWNLVCGFARNSTELLIFRFLAGLGGSAPMAIGGGVLADTFSAEQRGIAVSIYTLGPLLGPALGPIAGGFMTETIGWRWTFWIVSIADTAIQVLGFLLLRETYGPVLLTRKLQRKQRETGSDMLYATANNADVTLAKKLETGFARPIRLLFTQPIVICFALYMAYLYGIIYLILSSFTSLFTDHYGESIGIAGLNYIAIALGFAIGAQGTARLTDKVYACFKERNNGVGRPEFRIVIMVPCAIGVPIGLLWYGWSAQARIHWIMPDIGVAIFAAAVMTGSRAVQNYILDTYTRYVASAMASINTVRSLAGFAFPLLVFATYLYDDLGYGWGNSLLAFIAILIGVPAPWLFWRYGERLRQRSRFCAGE